MNLSMWVTFAATTRAAKLVAYFGPSLPFDIAHATGNIALLPRLRPALVRALAALPHALRHHLAPPTDDSTRTL